MKKLLAFIIPILLVLTAIPVIAIGGGLIALTATLSSLQGTTQTCTTTSNAAYVVDPSNVPAVPGLTATQVSNAAIIMKVGADLGFDQRGQLVALMTAMQESKLGISPGWNKPDENHDAGVFQQRILPGWYGTLEEVNDTATGAKKFYLGVDVTQTVPGGAGNAGYHIPGLQNIKNWQTRSLTAAAQAVQRSAYPDAYAQWEAPMTSLMATLAGVPVTASTGTATDPTLGCGAGLPAAAVGDLPTQAQLAAPSSQYACPEGTVDLGVADGGFEGRHVPIRLCSIPGTVCTGMDCGKGQLGGKARGEVVLNSLVAPHFINWLTQVRAAGYNPQFSSSFRSWESQAAVRYKNGGINHNAAPVGMSNHQMGAAVDISGLKGSYSKKIGCIGYAADGACIGADPAWPTYHEVALANGATFHDQEHWHLEWIVTRASSRNIPFILAA